MTGSVHNLTLFQRNRNLFIFTVCWLSGLLAGFILAAEANGTLLSLMRLAAVSRVSIVWLLLSAALPFLITAYSVFINNFLILFGISLTDAFAFSYCAGVIFRSFGSAGWLVQPMLQFTGTVLGAFFCWFCIRRCSKKRICLKKDLVLCLIISAVVVVIDFLLVSRFLGMLIDY